MFGEGCRAEGAASDGLSRPAINNGSEHDCTCAAEQVSHALIVELYTFRPKHHEPVNGCNVSVHYLEGK